MHTYYLNRQIPNLCNIYKPGHFNKFPVGWRGFKFQALTVSASDQLPVYVKTFYFKTNLESDPLAYDWANGKTSESDLTADKILALNGFRGVEVTAVETNVHIRVKQRYDEVS